MRILLKDVRIAFPVIWSPKPGPSGGEPAFSAAFILPKTHRQIGELKAAMKAVAKEKWGAKHESVYKAMEAGNRLALHDGDTKSEYEGYEGNLFVNSRSKVRPNVFDQQRNDLKESDGKILSGYYVDVSLELWAQDNEAGGKRINAQLRGVQLRRKGDVFTSGGTSADADEFDEISVEEDEGGTDPLTE
jgi:hypothetical protein